MVCDSAQLSTGPSPQGGYGRPYRPGGVHTTPAPARPRGSRHRDEAAVQRRFPYGAGTGAHGSHRCDGTAHPNGRGGQAPATAPTRSGKTVDHAVADLRCGFRASRRASVRASTRSWERARSMRSAVHGGGPQLRRVQPGFRPRRRRPGRRRPRGIAAGTVARARTRGRGPSKRTLAVAGRPEPPEGAHGRCRLGRLRAVQPAAVGRDARRAPVCTCVVAGALGEGGGPGRTAVTDVVQPVAMGPGHAVGALDGARRRSEDRSRTANSRHPALPGHLGEREGGLAGACSVGAVQDDCPRSPSRPAASTWPSASLGVAGDAEPFQHRRDAGDSHRHVRAGVGPGLAEIGRPRRTQRLPRRTQGGAVGVRRPAVEGIARPSGRSSRWCGTGQIVRGVPARSG